MSLTVDSPTVVRGGLVFTTVLRLRAHRAVHDAQLLLDQGWYRGMTFNGLSPQPSQESSTGRWQVLDYGALDAGTVLTVYVSWQAEPTQADRRSQDVQVRDGDSPLLTVHRRLVVLP